MTSSLYTSSSFELLAKSCLRDSEASVNTGESESQKATHRATQAEGIEDRMNMANLSARRLSNMVELGFRCTALSAIIGCQAMDLRGNGSMERFGPTLKGVHQCVRSFIPALKPESSPPHFTAVETFVNALKHCVMFEIVKKQQQKSKL